MKIVVLGGGISTERQVSLVTSTSVCRALRSVGHKAIFVDMFLGLEDYEGSLEDAFDAEDGFCGSLSSGMAMDKAVTKRIMDSCGVMNAKWTELCYTEEDIPGLLDTLPGMTPNSLIPKTAKLEGLSYAELCEKIIELSLKEKNKK